MGLYYVHTREGGRWLRRCAVSTPERALELKAFYESVSRHAKVMPRPPARESEEALSVALDRLIAAGGAL